MPTAKDSTLAILRALATRPGHDEVKSHIARLLVDEFGVDEGAVEFERRVPEVRGRLDALIGRTVFEAKSNLDREWADVLSKMPDYLADREREEKQRFVGVATDGLKWVAFELDAGKLVRVKDATLYPDKAELFLAWLDGVVALKAELPPEPLTIRMELGQDSIAFRRAMAELAAVWKALADKPDVLLKRQLWASLLKLAYGKDVESDALWFQHTYLVIVAKAIAGAVLGVRDDDPGKLLGGNAFRAANIVGAVESDFFDWVVAAPEGCDLVRRLLAHVRRFRLGEVEADIMKVLYESLIDRTDRHGLGEYYTPDWLAAKIVRHAVTAPLEQRVLDPACGSGAFLFHAIRRALAEAEHSGVSAELQAATAADMVAGFDIHPVAVIIARVTVLLALAPAIQVRRGRLSIPVYLGDAMQLSVEQMMSGRELLIPVPPGPGGKNGVHLKFPGILCAEPAMFDKLIEAMRRASETGQTRADLQEEMLDIIHEHYGGCVGIRPARRSKSAPRRRRRSSTWARPS
jgi:hypothetical protein